VTFYGNTIYSMLSSETNIMQYINPPSNLLRLLWMQYYRRQKRVAVHWLQ